MCESLPINCVLLFLLMSRRPLNMLSRVESILPSSSNRNLHLPDIRTNTSLSTHEQRDGNDNSGGKSHSFALTKGHNFLAQKHITFSHLFITFHLCQSTASAFLIMNMSLDLALFKWWSLTKNEMKINKSRVICLCFRLCAASCEIKKKRATL